MSKDSQTTKRLWKPKDLEANFAHLMATDHEFRKAHLKSTIIGIGLGIILSPLFIWWLEGNFK